jgi:hypothetical protein
MVLYSYICKRAVTDGIFPMWDEHEISEFYEMGKAPDRIVCKEHDVECNRDFGALQVHPMNDEFRSYHLSMQGERAANEQGRPLDPNRPKDKFEAKEIANRTGRVYVGNDVSKLSEAGQRAIHKGEQRSYAYQNGGGLADD